MLVAEGSGEPEVSAQMRRVWQPTFRHESGRYDIHITAHMPSRWADRFEALTITRKDSGAALLTGPVADQAALHGLLKKVRDLGMPLVSVTRVRPGETDAMHA